MFDNTQDVLSDPTEARGSESTSLFSEAMQMLGSQQFRSNEGLQGGRQNTANEIFGTLDLFDSQDDGSLVLSRVKGKTESQPKGGGGERASAGHHEVEKDADRPAKRDQGEPDNKFEIDKTGLRRAVIPDED